LAIDGLGEKLEEIRSRSDVVTAAPRIYAPALAALGEDGHTVVVVGIDFEAEQRPGGLLYGVEGLDDIAEGTVLVGEALARTMGDTSDAELAIVGQGADGSLANDLYRIAGVLTSSVDLVNRLGVVMPLGQAQELFVLEGRAHEITIRGQDVQGAEALAVRLSTLESLEGQEVLAWPELVPELVTIVDMNRYISLILLLLVFIAAAAGIANTTLMATFERKREFGMLLALGTDPRRVVQMVVVEALMLGILGVLVGSLIGMLGVEWLAADGFTVASMAGDEAATDITFAGINLGFQIYPRLESLDVVYGVVAVIFTSTLTALWPAWHSSRLRPVEAMRG
jgi:ABC-type lipoprotein release transport system permease subunit